MKEVPWDGKLSGPPATGHCIERGLYIEIGIGYLRNKGQAFMIATVVRSGMRAKAIVAPLRIRSQSSASHHTVVKGPKSTAYTFLWRASCLYLLKGFKNRFQQVKRRVTFLAQLRTLANRCHCVTSGAQWYLEPANWLWSTEVCWSDRLAG